jgi:Protein of unknown function (DUF3592)
VRLDAATVRRVGRVFGALALALGLAAAGTSGYWIVRLRTFEARAETTEGKVIVNEPVDWSSESSSGTGTTFHTSYRAIVRFADRSGRGVTYSDFLAFDPPSFSVGDRVKVLYDPQHPERAMIDRGKKVLFALLAICAFGAFLVVAGTRRLFESAKAVSLNSLHSDAISFRRMP